MITHQNAIIKIFLPHQNAIIILLEPHQNAIIALAKMRIIMLTRKESFLFPQQIPIFRQQFFICCLSFFSFSLIFFPFFKKKFVTKFVTCITKFVTCVSKFVTSVTKFVIKNLCARREKYQGERKILLADSEKYLGHNLPFLRNKFKQEGRQGRKKRIYLLRKRPKCVILQR